MTRVEGVKGRWGRGCLWDLGRVAGVASVLTACGKEPVYEYTPQCSQACPDGTNIASGSTTVADPSKGEFAFIQGQCETICRAKALCLSPNRPTVAVDGLTGAARYECKPLDGFSDLTPDDQTDLSFGEGWDELPKKVDVAVGEEPVTIGVGDVDGDGDDDLVTANARSEDLSVVLSGGDGTFAPEKRIDVAGPVHAVALAEMNGDGRADLVVSHTSSTPGEGWVLSLALSDGQGGFAAPSVLAQASEPFATDGVQLVAGHFDADQATDLIVTGLPVAGEATAILGDGTGGARATRGIDVCRTSGIAGCHRVVAGLLDADPYMDLLLTSKDGTMFMETRGDGAGAWSYRAMHGWTAYPTDALAVLDLAGDGSTDLLVVTGSSVGLSQEAFAAEYGISVDFTATSCAQAPLANREMARLGGRSVARLLPQCRQVAFWAFDAISSLDEEVVDLGGDPAALVAGALFGVGTTAVAVTLPSQDLVMVVRR